MLPSCRLLAVALILSLGLWGCHRQAPQNRPVSLHPPQPSASTLPGVIAIGAPPNLDRTLRMADMVEGSQMNEPLSLGRAIARAAGGDWIVLAPRPLDEVKWVGQNYYRMGSSSVNALLEMLRKNGTEIQCDLTRGYGFLYFGTKAEYESLRTAPPVDVKGILLYASNGDEMLRVIAEFWRIRIQADKNVLESRARLAANREQRRAADKEDMPSQAQMYGMGDVSGEEEPTATNATPALEWKAVKRLELRDLLQRMGEYFGGQAVEKEPGRWELKPLGTAELITTRIAQMKQTIDTESGAPAASTEPTGSRYNAEEFELPALPEEAQTAFDDIAVLGKPAIPALSGYLDSGRPALAVAATAELADMRDPEADRALVDFAGRLEGSLSGSAEAARAALQKALFHALAASTTKEALAAAEAAATNEKVAPAAREAVRRSLIARGEIAAFDKPATGDWQNVETVFTLAEPPAKPPAPGVSRPDQSPGSVVSITSTTAANGDRWAVFLSGRYGDRNDIWLARGSSGRWDEFLFTGQKFRKNRRYGDDSGEGGACTLNVEGDHVTISPPDPKLHQEVEQLMKKMQDPKLPQQQRIELSKKYSELSPKASQALGRTITLSLSELRKDSDSDGLPDVVEKRLGTDPNRTDTDGDGVPDGKDGNPLAAPDRNPADRALLLQLLFTALYGGDTSIEPIVVVLDHANWQEFRGSRACVLCIVPQDFMSPARPSSAFRALQFGGPSEAISSILMKDGPCLYTDDKSRAEIHFWQWNRIMPDGRYGRYSRYGYMSGSQPVDYLARFEHKGEWKLVSVRPWKFQTAERAVQKYSSRAAMQEGMESE